MEENNNNSQEFEPKTIPLNPENEPDTAPVTDEETKPFDESATIEETKPIESGELTEPVGAQPAESKKSNKKKLIAIIIAFVALLGCAGGAYYFLTKTPDYKGGTWKALFKKMSGAGSAKDYDSATKRSIPYEDYNY